MPLCVFPPSDLMFSDVNLVFLFPLESGGWSREPPRACLLVEFNKQTKKEIKDERNLKPIIFGSGI